MNRLGMGFRRAVKPDLLMPGNRQLFLEECSGTNGKTRS